MKTEIIKTEGILYICEMCGSTSYHPSSISDCEYNCRSKIIDECDHEFFFDLDVDIDYKEIDISRKCKKCDYIENTNSISVYSIEDYLTEDIIKKMYNKGE